MTKNAITSHARQASLSSTGRASPPQKGAVAATTTEAFPRVSGEYRRSGEFPRVSGDYKHPSGEHVRPSGDFLSRANIDNGKSQRRKSSLSERFPGDPSVHPLDVIKQETRAANRAPHLQKRHLPGADSIDRLDDAGFRYHHEGPYDAALLARNTDVKSSPVAALATSNEAALKATPTEKIQDAVRGHRPLEGTADIAPGNKDSQGRVLQYDEADIMREDGGDAGNYRRWTDEVGSPYPPTLSPHQPLTIFVRTTAPKTSRASASRNSPSSRISRTTPPAAPARSTALSS